MATHAHVCAQPSTLELTARHTPMPVPTTHAKMVVHALSLELETPTHVPAQLVTLDQTAKSITHAMPTHV
jgi:hypothetical protein